MNIVLIT